MNVIPSIDLRGGSCVRLLRGEFGSETHYSDDPVDIARRYGQTGFSHLHVVDLDGARTGNQQHQELVAKIADASQLSVQLGGGIRTRDSVSSWLNRVSRCVIGSLAVTEPGIAADWLREFGPERIVLALDVRWDQRTAPILVTHGWTRSAQLTLWQCVERFCGAGLRHVLCTDTGVDGSLTGPNLALYREFRRRFPEISVQASGGVRDLGDLRALRDLGCSAAITGRALLEGRIAEEEMSSFLRSA